MNTPGLTLDADGHLVKGTMVRSKEQLADLLSHWLQASAAATIGDVGTFGGTPWVRIELDGLTAVLNADTTRAAAREYVDHARRHGPGTAWQVVANRRGRINKVVFREDKQQTPGWFCYLTRPLTTPGAVAARRVSEPVYVVQFPHPGGEHHPKDAEQMAWNTRPHARKFLRSPGRFVDRDGVAHDGDLAFWGEWEPPSRVLDRWPPAGRLPRFLHQPVWGEPDLPTPRQNTDPWVFGDAFLYSNCKQLTPHGTPSALQSLTEGSVVLFGSQLDGDFVLDTVLVVADATRYTPTRAAHLEVDDAFRVCTLQSLAIPGGKDHREAPFTLYRGATATEPVEGMFSFVPARPASSPDHRFARPAITLPGHINPNSKQSPSGAGQPRTVDQVRDAWASVRDQVLAAGCVLGIAFPTPARVQAAVVPADSRHSC